MSKWKMAEAFGRALQRASVDGGKAEKYINAARRVGKTNPAAEGKFQEGVIKGANDAIDAGKAADEAEELGIDLGKTLEDRTGGYIDAMNDARTDRALQRDFDEAFDEAVKTHVKKDPNKGKFTEEEIRGGAIGMLKGGARIEDVLDFLLGNMKD